METVWTSSPELNQLYLEVTVNSALGAVVLQECADEAPIVVFCSLFPEPQKFFHYVSNRRDYGVTLDELKSLVEHIERKLAERPFPPEQHQQ